MPLSFRCWNLLRPQACYRGRHSYLNPLLHMRAVYGSTVQTVHVMESLSTSHSYTCSHNLIEHH